MKLRSTIGSSVRRPWMNVVATSARSVLRESYWASAVTVTCSVTAPTSNAKSVWVEGSATFGGRIRRRLGWPIRRRIRRRVGRRHFTTSSYHLSVSPGSGPAYGGTSVVINGKDFVKGAVVTIGSSPARDVDVTNSTTIIATTVARAAGSADVVVTNPDGQQSTINGAFKYMIVPRIISASISSKKLVLQGDDFSIGATIILNGIERPRINGTEKTLATIACR